MSRCSTRWDILIDNLKPIDLFLFSSTIFTAFPHCLKKLWWDPSGGFGAGKPRSALWEAVPITERDSGRSHSMHTSSKRARVSQSIHDLRGLMSPQAYIRDLVSPSHVLISNSRSFLQYLLQAKGIGSETFYCCFEDTIFSQLVKLWVFPAYQTPNNFTVQSQFFTLPWVWAL